MPQPSADRVQEAECHSRPRVADLVGSAGRRGPRPHRVTAARAERLAAAYQIDRLARMQASARTELRLLSAIHKAAESDWLAAAWILERRWPDRWALPSKRLAVRWITPLRSSGPPDRQALVLAARCAQ